MDQRIYMGLARQRVMMTSRRTAEQQQRDMERRQREAALYEERIAAQAVAKNRSKELLLSHLTPQQRETLEKNRWFVVEGGNTRQLYRIRDNSISGNIDVLEGRPGKVTHRLCCHLRDYNIPLYDHLLAQKVWIERDEEAFLKTANRHAA